MDYQVGNGALFPMEVCSIVPGQFCRRSIPSDKTTDMVEFSKSAPSARLDLIAQKGRQVSTLPTVVDHFLTPFTVAVLRSIRIRSPIRHRHFGKRHGCQGTRSGCPSYSLFQSSGYREAQGWSMESVRSHYHFSICLALIIFFALTSRSQKLYRPVEIGDWALVIFEERRFNMSDAQAMAKDFVDNAKVLGIDPLLFNAR